MRIYLGQIDTTVGGFESNLNIILKHIKEAEAKDADLAIFPELALTGYPPMDLLNYSSFVDNSERYLKKLVEKIGETAVLVGYVEKSRNRLGAERLYNSAALIQNRKILFNYRKALLPTYDVFDEDRYFTGGENFDTYEFKGVRLAISICEDLWNDKSFWEEPMYDIDPIEEMVKNGADLLINISSSPFTIDKIELRYKILCAQTSKHGVAGIMLNSVGGNDELIFDGTSMYCDPEGRLIHKLSSFKEDTAIIDVPSGGTEADKSFLDMPKEEQAYNALRLGVSDYFKKCGFTRAVLGLSGGIDSAVTACIGVDALGAENLLAVVMPSRYSSDKSIEDAKELAKRLKIKMKMISIDTVFAEYLDLFSDEFKGLEMDETEENFQARIRGNILMAFSNKYGHLVLSTGNKSEIAVGYCTLYGDMAGGLAVLSDVPKRLVYRIAEFINREKEVIPRSIIEKPPSAELKPDQTDQDTLPPYELLDEVLYHYIEKEQDLETMVELGFDRDTVRRIIRMVDISEYKRKQMPTGLKITGRAFGFGRRMPIAQKYHRF